MAYDPVHQWQLHLRRAANVLRSRGLLAVPPESHEATPFDTATQERFFETGYQQVAKLAAQIERHTGCTLESRRALDFGCGRGRLALPLAERCEYVYGVDVSPSVLREADRNAKRMNVSNVEWLETGRLAELSGRYDLVQSAFVFQHIPSREGERIFATLVRGLRPGGVGAIHLTVRPSHPLAGFFRTKGKSVPSAYNPFNLVRGRDWSYPYMLLHSYSLNRIGRLLVDAGVTQWHTRFTPTTERSYDAVTIIFRKKGGNIEGHGAAREPGDVVRVLAPFQDGASAANNSDSAPRSSRASEPVTGIPPQLPADGGS
jgi:2-polyprenyl-3-methyl-5-hydroxy-6-metoxy-1,4-benzoquinol methylase